MFLQSSKKDESKNIDSVLKIKLCKPRQARKGMYKGKRIKRYKQSKANVDK